MVLEQVSICGVGNAVMERRIWEVEGGGRAHSWVAGCSCVAGDKIVGKEGYAAKADLSGKRA